MTRREENLDDTIVPGIKWDRVFRQFVPADPDGNENDERLLMMNELAGLIVEEIERDQQNRLYDEQR